MRFAQIRPKLGGLAYITALSGFLLTSPVGVLLAQKESNLRKIDDHVYVLRRNAVPVFSGPNDGSERIGSIWGAIKITGRHGAWYRIRTTPLSGSGFVASRSLVEALTDEVGIVEIQEMLMTAGFDPGVVDGVLGAETRSAIRRLQNHLGLPEDGQTSSNMILMLRSIAARSDGFNFLAAREQNPAPGPTVAKHPQVRLGDKLNVMELAGTTQDQVAAVLGAPTSCGSVNISRDSKSDLKCIYLAGKIEIIFVGLKADWITIYEVKGPFSPSTLAEIGLQPRPPTIRNPVMLRWNGFPNLREVSMFAGRGNAIHYILVTTKTP